MFDRLPPATRALLWSNVLVFFADQFLLRGAFVNFMLWPFGEFPAGYANGGPLSVGFLPWQLVTYGFLHGNMVHLFFNMFALSMFGASVEMVWGSKRFAAYYFVCLAGAGLVQLIVATAAVQSGALYPTVGASGAVFGLLLAYGMMFPNRQVMLLLPPIPMKARTLVVVYGAIELVMGVTGTLSGIAHFAHLGGMLFGFGMIQYWRGRWPFGRR